MRQAGHKPRPKREKKMDWETATRKATMGGCGMLAMALMEKFPGATPLLRYSPDGDGTAVHAAVLHDGELLHLGSIETGFVPVSMEELERACNEDFDPDRVDCTHQDVSDIISLMFPAE